MIEEIPNEIFCIIFAYVEYPSDLRAAASVCTRFRNIILLGESSIFTKSIFRLIKGPDSTIVNLAHIDAVTFKEYVAQNHHCWPYFISSDKRQTKRAFALIFKKRVENNTTHSILTKEKLKANLLSWLVMNRLMRIAAIYVDNSFWRVNVTLGSLYFGSLRKQLHVAFYREFIKSCDIWRQTAANCEYFLEQGQHKIVRKILFAANKISKRIDICIFLGRWKLISILIDRKLLRLHHIRMLYIATANQVAPDRDQQICEFKDYFLIRWKSRVQKNVCAEFGDSIFY